MKNIIVLLFILCATFQGYVIPMENGQNSITESHDLDTEESLKDVFYTLATKSISIPSLQICKGLQQAYYGQYNTSNYINSKAIIQVSIFILFRMLRL